MNDDDANQTDVTRQVFECSIELSRLAIQSYSKDTWGILKAIHRYQGDLLEITFPESNEKGIVDDDDHAARIQRRNGLGLDRGAQPDEVERLRRSRTSLLKYLWKAFAVYKILGSESCSHDSQ